MAKGFWQQVFVGHHVPAMQSSPPVSWSPPESTPVVATLWQRRVPRSAVLRRCCMKTLCGWGSVARNFSGPSAGVTRQGLQSKVHPVWCNKAAEAKFDCWPVGRSWPVSRAPPVAGVRRPACRPALASADEDPVGWPRRLAPHRRVVGCVRRCRNLVSIPGRSAASAVQADIGHHPRRARPVPATGAPCGGVGGFVRRCGGCVAAAAGSRAVGRRWAWR